MRITGGALVLLCLVICGVQATYLVESVRLVVHGARVTGVVVESDPSRDGGTFPVVAWSDGAGGSHRLQSRAGRNLKLGSRVRVVYLPEQTGLARIDTAMALWLPLLVTLPVCALFGGPGLLLVWLSLPKDAPGAEAA